MTFRPVYPRIYFAFTGGGPLLVLAAIIAGMFEFSNVAYRATLSLGQVWVAYFWFRCATMKVDVSAREVVVRNIASTKTFAAGTYGLEDRGSTVFRWNVIRSEGMREPYFVAASFRNFFQFAVQTQMIRELSKYGQLSNPGNRRQ
jgi:hypothetical protein